VLWGSGKPKREFLHVSDLAKACIFLLEHYDSPETINVGTGNDLTIRNVAELISNVTGYTGNIIQDETKPDGTPRKVLDVTRINELGWKSEITLEQGLQDTYQWFLENQTHLRAK
jgi:GDP-L-fucose synthase